MLNASSDTFTFDEINTVLNVKTLINFYESYLIKNIKKILN